MKSIFNVLVFTIFASVALSFQPSINDIRARGKDDSALFMTKRYPAGRPVTVQLDEDMAMWFEDKQGNRQKALKKPVGGRPAALFTKEEVEAIEKKGVSPLERIAAFLEYTAKRPTRGY